MGHDRIIGTHDAESDREAFAVRLPEVADQQLDQDGEWCTVQTVAGTQRIRFHDYARIYEIPGLYERLFYDELQCTSPRTVRQLLETVLEQRQIDPEELTVLDVGAGNGMVGEELDDLGVNGIVGVDILEEAAAAAARDRPGVYDDYRVMDLTDPAPADHDVLADAGFNCLTSVAALGFGDIPPAAFAQAFDYVADGGLVAFTIKDRFTVSEADDSGFSGLIRDLYVEGRIEPIVEQRYRHRLSISGEPLEYVAYIASKQGSEPTARP
jgi:predicted TPR repeat methyltransferase